MPDEPPVRLLPLPPPMRVEVVLDGIAEDVSARITFVPALTPEATCTWAEPTMPRVTCAVDSVLSLPSTRIVPAEVPVRVTADTGTTIASSAEAIVTTAVAVVPDVNPDCGELTTIVTG